MGQAYLEDLFGLEGKVALVTGASSGLGRHFAKVLARAGAEVVLAARRQERLDELAARIEADGGQAHAVVMDVTDPGSVTAALEEAAEAAGPIDVLVNNAGVSRVKPFLEHTEEDWELITQVNLHGVRRVARGVAASMKARGQGGVIVNIASISGLGTGGRFAAYATSKAAVIHLTEVLAEELARHDIRVNALAPGYFATEMNEAFLASEAGDRIRERVPTRRFGELEDLDGALLLMCSPASRHITGQILAVDGGHAVAPL